jgi:hypothetical protein
MNRRAQSSVEFVGLLMFMFVVFFGFFIVIQNQISDVTEKKDTELLGSLNNIVVSQIYLAATSNADFSHRFSLPVLENVYEVTLPDPYEIVASLPDGRQYVNFIPFPVRGFIEAPGVEQTVYRFDRFYTHALTGQRVEETNLEGIFLNVDAEACYVADSSGNCAATLSGPEIIECQTHVDATLC